MPILIAENRIRQQGKSQWCFAACIQMLLEFYMPDTIITQTQIVNKMRENENADDVPLDPDNYLSEYTTIAGSMNKSVPSWKTIKTEIDRGCPILVRLSGGSGHYVLIVGYEGDKFGRVYIIDPTKNTYTIEVTNPVDAYLKTVDTAYESEDGSTITGPQVISGYMKTKQGGVKPGQTLIGGFKPIRSRKSGVTRKKRGGKWSLKYKRSINCKRPKGFSQKQHCKYGRKK